MRLSEEQIERRKLGIGGSDAATVLGMSRWKTPERLRQEKLGLVEPEPGNLKMELGHLLEPVIVSEFTEATGLEVQPDGTEHVHPEHLVLRGNVDGIIGPDALLECKAPGRLGQEWGEEWSDQVPVEYLLQCMHYMGVLPWVQTTFVAALELSSASLRIYKIERDQPFIDMMVTRELSWWQRHIVEGVPCPPKVPEDLRLLYPKDDGSEMLADALTAERVSRLIGVKAALKLLEEEREQLENEVRAAFGAHSTLVWQGSPVATYKAQTAIRLDAKRLKEEAPELWRRFSHEVTTRVLRLK